MYTVQWKMENVNKWRNDKSFTDLDEALRFAMAQARSHLTMTHRVTRPKSNGLPKVLAKFKPMRDE